MSTKHIQTLEWLAEQLAASPHPDAPAKLAEVRKVLAELKSAK